MTPPIDLLALAADRVATANAAVQSTQLLQAGPSADTAYWHAVIEHDRAVCDMALVRQLVLELGDA